MTHDERCDAMRRDDAGRGYMQLYRLVSKDGYIVTSDTRPDLEGLLAFMRKYWHPSVAIFPDPEHGIARLRRTDRSPVVHPPIQSSE